MLRAVRRAAPRPGGDAVGTRVFATGSDASSEIATRHALKWRGTLAREGTSNLPLAKNGPCTQKAEMSPLLRALLRANPKQYAAAVSALATVSLRSTRNTGRTVLQQYRSYGQSVATSPAFARVWGEASLFLQSAKRAPRNLGQKSIASQAWQALPGLPRLRAPSQLYVLGHQGRDAAVASKLPNFSGALVMLLVGGSNLAPATARCLEASPKQAKQDSLVSKTKQHKGCEILVPKNVAYTSWVDRWVPAPARAWVERCVFVFVSQIPPPRFQAQDVNHFCFPIAVV